MEKIVLDSYTWLAYLQNEAGANKISGLLNEIFSGKKDAHMSAINYGEVLYMSRRKGGEELFAKAENLLKHFPMTIEDATLDVCLAAAEWKAKISFSYANAFAASLTQRLNATLVTGDPEFKPLKGKIKIEFI